MAKNYSVSSAVNKASPIKRELNVAPEKAKLKNLHTGEFKDFLLNPETLSLDLQGQYYHRDIKGMGNMPMDYNKGTNPFLKFDVYFNLLNLQNQKNLTRLEAREKMEDWRHFLNSFIFPIFHPALGNIGSSSPKAWFYWENNLFFTAQITSIQWQSTQMQLDGTPVQLIATVEMSNNNNVSLWSQDVRKGSLQYAV